jgi:hypothetical protein
MDPEMVNVVQAVEPEKLAQQPQQQQRVAMD